MQFQDFQNRAARADRNENDIAHFFSRNFAVPVGYALDKFHLSPNHITWMFLAAGFASAVSLYAQLPLLSYVLWRSHIILDMVDGTVARARQNFSKSAVGFDRSNHIIINSSLLFASLYQSQSFLALNFILCSFYLSYFFSRNYFQEKQATRGFSMRQTLVKNAIGLEGYLIVTCLLIWANLPQYQVPAAVVYGVFFLVIFLRKLQIFQKQTERKIRVFHD